MMLSVVANYLERGLPINRRDQLDALHSVLAYVSKQWYETEYGVNGAGDWYRRAMVFLEDLYAQTAREKEA